MAGLEKIQMTLDYYTLVIVVAIINFSTITLIALYLLRKYGFLP